MIVLIPACYVLIILIAIHLHKINHNILEYERKKEKTANLRYSQRLGKRDVYSNV